MVAILAFIAGSVVTVLSPKVYLAVKAKLVALGTPKV